MDMSYVLFDSRLLHEANIDLRKNPGTSLDQEANAWHHDLVLSGNKLVALAKAILEHGDSGTALKIRLQQLVDEGIREGQLPERLRKNL